MNQIDANREAIFSGLNPQQRQAAEAIDGAYLVVAGAGSGKTTVLSRRVAALIAAGIDPSSILLLTFTKNAARNMIERAVKLTPAAAGVTSGTFHAVGHRLIVENHKMFRLPEQPTLLDPDDVKSAFKKISSEFGNKAENLPTPAALAGAHSFSVNTKRDLEDVVWEKYEEFGYAVDFFKKCSEEYRNYKRSCGVLDFDDLLIAWDAMMDHPKVGAAVRERFQYVLVDEDQDSNAIQCSIVAKLGFDKANVMAVGDPAQAIYGFRGSAPRTMFSFMERWPHATIINLDTNYRSNEGILDVANAVDHSMAERFERELRPAPGATGGQPKLINVPDMRTEANQISDRVLELKDDGVPLHEQAVLVRSMSYARHIEAEFVRRKIPYQVTGGIKINEAAHIKDLVCLVRVAVNSLDEPAWMRVLTMPKGVGPKKAVSVYKEIISSGTDLFSDPSDIMRKLEGKHPEIKTIIEAYVTLRRAGSPSFLLDKAVTILDDMLSNRYKEDWKSRKPDIAAVCSLAEGQETLDGFLATLSLDLSVDKKAKVIGVEDGEKPMTISTVHSAKGLEWDAVFIPSFYDGHMPSVYSRDPKEMEEEKRVLYVAVTRPKKILEIYRPAFGRIGYGGEPALMPESPFEHIIYEHLKVSRIGAEPRPVTSFKLDTGDEYVDFF